MLYPTAGSRLYISDTPAERPGDLPASGWVEVAEVEAIGLLGIEWDMDVAEVMDCDSDSDIPREDVIKTIPRRPEMPLIMGNVPNDPGQLLLWKAAHDIDQYPFRLVFPDGVTVREWFALVFRIGEVFDAANSVIRLQVDLKPTSLVPSIDGA